MAAPKEKVEPWLSVPQFGDWELKGRCPTTQWISRKFEKCESKTRGIHLEPVLEMRKSSLVQIQQTRPPSTMLNALTIEATLLQLGGVSSDASVAGQRLKDRRR